MHVYVIVLDWACLIGENKGVAMNELRMNESKRLFDMNPAVNSINYNNSMRHIHNYIIVSYVIYRVFTKFPAIIVP